jgi:diguanylate cyclase (GGDEF)-like protein
MGDLAAVLNGLIGFCCVAIAALLLHGAYRSRRSLINPTTYAVTGIFAFAGAHFLLAPYLIFFSASAAEESITLQEVLGRTEYLVVDGLLCLSALTAIAFWGTHPSPWSRRPMFQRTARDTSRGGVVDPLTGLPNRSALLDTAKRHLGDDSHAIVLDIDLYGLREVNVEHGRDAGDRVLRDVAQRLAGGIREREYIFHLSGVELVVVGIGHGPADAASLYSRTESLISRSISVPGGNISVENSVGAKFGTANDLENLVNQARGSALRASGNLAI